MSEFVLTRTCFSQDHQITNEIPITKTTHHHISLVSPRHTQSTVHVMYNTLAHYAKYILFVRETYYVCIPLL